MELPASALKHGSDKSVPLPPENHLLGLEGIKPAHPDVNALRCLVVEIRARSPALSEGGRLLSFLEYLLSLLVRQNHAAELESGARVPSPSPANRVAGEPVIIRLLWHKEPHGDFWRVEVIGHVYEVHDDKMADYKGASAPIRF
jgi:hypothetical protein